MKVFVDTMFCSTFSIDLDPRNKVFDIKKSIENSQGIPVSMQKLYFNDVELAVDHYQLREYRIVNNSHLFLLLRADHVNNQMLHQSSYAIQGFAPSMGRSIYDQSHWPASTTEAIASENHMFQTEYLPVQSNSTEDFPVRVVSRDKVFQTEKLIVIMTQYDKPGRKFLVEVNESDNVEELKKVLVNIQQKYQLDLPTKGYFLIHNQRVLDDDKSFSMNRVANGDTIEIFPGPDIEV